MIREVIHTPPRTGRTTDLIEWVKAAPPGERRVMVTYSADIAKMHQRAHRQIAPGSIVAWADRRMIPHDAVIAIDDLDEILKRELGQRHIAKVTIADMTEYLARR